MGTPGEGEGLIDGLILGETEGDAEAETLGLADAEALGESEGLIL